MIKLKKSNNIICSKKELKMLHPYLSSYVCIYELPLFDLSPKTFSIYNFLSINTDYVLIRGVDRKFSDRSLASINKTWNTLYENKH